MIVTTWPTVLTQQECNDEGYTDTCADMATATDWLFNCVEDMLPWDPPETAYTSTVRSSRHSAEGCNLVDKMEVDYDVFVTGEDNVCSFYERIEVDSIGYCGVGDDDW